MAGFFDFIISNSVTQAHQAAGAFGVAYYTYGRFLSRRILRIRPENTWPSIIAVTLMYVFVWVGAMVPVDLAATGIGPVGVLSVWIIIVLGYALVASLLPVQTLLQPRDYINSHQLMIAMGLIVAGVLWTQPTVVAPAVHVDPAGAPALLPFIFMIIACGAISGFHCLVSSGTSSKQYAKPVFTVKFDSSVYSVIKWIESVAIKKQFR